MSKFPDGMYWNHIGSDNNSNGYTSTPCTHHGSACSIKENGCDCNFFNNAIQCAGYAYKLAYELTGSIASEENGWEKKTEELDASSLCVGDIIRYFNNSHSVVVVGVSGNTIAYTGANWGANCLIRWSAMDVSDVRGFSYVFHKKDNKTKNSNLAFLDVEVTPQKPSQPSSPVYKKETWVNTNDDKVPLNMRKSPSTSADIVTKIPYNASFTVSDKQFDKDYLWGKVTYGSYTGWAALNWATYKGGSKDKLNINDAGNYYAGIAYNLTWNAIKGANRYTVYIYDSSGDTIATYSTSSTNRTVTIDIPGKNYIRIVAKNTNSKSWSVKSKKEEISVIAADDVNCKKIRIPSKMQMTTGGTDYVDFNISPVSAVLDLKWKTSKSSVVAVDKYGKVTAVRPGKATITCYAKSNNKIKDTCVITVIPKKVTGIKQTSDVNSTKKISLSWKAVDYVNGYKVYVQKKDGSYYCAANTTKTSATFDKLDASTDYKVMIRAYKKLGDTEIKSEYSSVVKVSTAPSKVSGLRVTNRTNIGYTLRWNKVKNADKYLIYKYNKNTKKYEQKYSSTTNSKVFTNKHTDVRYYKVKACTKSGSVWLTGSLSDSVFAFKNPNAPKVSKSSKKTSVTLKWKSVAGATGYQVYFYKNGKYVLAKGTSSLSYTRSKLKPNTKYTFKVRARTVYKGVTSYGKFTKVAVRTAK